MDFQTLTRRELQSLCKMNKIAANQTNAAMANALKALDIVQGMEDVISKTSQSESAQSSIESPEKMEVTSPTVPRTGHRTSVRRKPPVREVSASVPAPTRTALGGARRKIIVVGEAEEAKNDAPETPAAAPNSRNLAPVASTRRKLVSQLKETEDKKTGDEADLLDKKDVPRTPGVTVSIRRWGTALHNAVEEEGKVQRVYSTRRSVRLSEKKVVESNPKEKGHKSTETHSFSKEMDESVLSTLDDMGEVSVDTSVPGGDSQKILEDSLETIVDSGVLLALKSNVSSEAVADARDCVQMSTCDLCEVDDASEKMEDNLDAVDESDLASVLEAQSNIFSVETQGESENKFQNGDNGSKTTGEVGYDICDAAGVFPAENLEIALDKHNLDQDKRDAFASEDNTPIAGFENMDKLIAAIDEENEISENNNEDDSETDAGEVVSDAEEGFQRYDTSNAFPGEILEKVLDMHNEGPENKGEDDLETDASKDDLDTVASEDDSETVASEDDSESDASEDDSEMEAAVEVSVQQNLIGNEGMGPGCASENTCELPWSSHEKTADPLQGQIPLAGLLHSDFMTHPAKKSASKTPTAIKRTTCISDEKENIGYSGGRALELTKEKGNKNNKKVAEDDMQKALQTKSLRQLEKMLKEKLQIRNGVKRWGGKAYS